MSLLRSSLSDAKLDRWIISFLGAGIMFAGCSKDSASIGDGTTVDSAVTSADSSGESGKMSGTVGDNAGAGTKRRRDEVWTDDKGQKWFGNVPMDAFFDQPYEVAANQTPLGVVSGAIVATAPESSSMGSSGTNDSTADSKPVGEKPASEMTEAATKPDATDTPGSAGAGSGGDSWAALISSTTLDDEVKSIRNFLNENVHSVGTFNSSMLMIPPKAAAIGALAGVAMEHPETVSWKDDAKYIRDLAKKMNSSALQRGAKDQKRIEALYDALSDTLNRSKPAGMEEPPETDSFAEVSEMRLLMMRIEEAQNKMKTEAGTDSSMGSKKDMITHESSVLATLTKIVSTPGYGYGDDPKFTGYANDVVKAALEAKSAAQGNDFASYEGALTKIATTCANCHSDYKSD